MYIENYTDNWKKY